MFSSSQKVNNLEDKAPQARKQKTSPKSFAAAPGPIHRSDLAILATAETNSAIRAAASSGDFSFFLVKLNGPMEAPQPSQVAAAGSGEVNSD
jgi:hypothetical protein